MIFALIGLAIGILVGFFWPFEIPLEWARYSAVGLLGMADAIFGAVKADLEREYDPATFLTGLFFSMTAAVIITYIGDQLGLDLYLAVLVVFTWRIFHNLARIREAMLRKLEEWR